MFGLFIFKAVVVQWLDLMFFWYTVPQLAVPPLEDRCQYLPPHLLQPTASFCTFTKSTFSAAYFCKNKKKKVSLCILDVLPPGEQVLERLSNLAWWHNIFGSWLASLGLHFKTSCTPNRGYCHNLPFSAEINIIYAPLYKPCQPCSLSFSPTQTCKL